VERCEAPTRHSMDSTLTENFTILSLSLSCYSLFNKMRTLKLEARPTDAFFAAEHLIDGGEGRICRLSFEFWSLHVIEKRSKCR